MHCCYPECDRPATVELGAPITAPALSRAYVSQVEDYVHACAEHVDTLREPHHVARSLPECEHAWESISARTLHQ